MLLLFAAAGFCAAAHAQSADDAVRLGWQRIQEKKYAAAEHLFFFALQSAPEHPEAHAGIGVALARRGEYARALPRLERARGRGSRYEHLELELGRAHFFRSQPKLALPHLEAYRKTHPNVWQTYEVLGLCYYRTGDYARCIDAFAHDTLRKQGTHPAMYLFYTGLATAALGDPASAGRQLDTVTRDFPDSPQARQIKEAAESKGGDPWQSARMRRSEQKWWYVLAGSEGRFDTNPISLGHDVIVPDSLSRDGTWVFAGYAGGGARIVNREDTLLNLEIHTSLNVHDELAEFDQNVVTGSLYAEHWLSDSAGLFASLGASRLWIDDDATLDQWSAGGGGYYRETDWTRTRVAVGFGNSEYFLDDLPEASDIDNRSTAAGIAQEFVFADAGLQLALGYDWRHQAADGSDYDADFHQASFSAAYELPWSLRLVGSVAYSRGDYDHGNSRDPANDARTDDVWTGSLRLQRPVTDWAAVYLGARLIDQESNVGFADYDRMQWFFGFDLKY